MHKKCPGFKSVANIWQRNIVHSPCLTRLEQMWVTGPSDSSQASIKKHTTVFSPQVRLKQIRHEYDTRAPLLLLKIMLSFKPACALTSVICRPGGGFSCALFWLRRQCRIELELEKQQGLP